MKNRQKQKTLTSLIGSLFIEVVDPDSNRGHTDFQSDALPTELIHLNCPR